MPPEPARLFRSFASRNVAVLGLGRSGMACARTLAGAGANLVAWDDDATQRAKGTAAGIRIQGPTWGQCCDAPDLLIVSPGIPHQYPEPHPVVAAARAASVAIDNDIGLFFRSLAVDCPAADRPWVVAITGSNGKSTTAALLHHLICACGKTVHLAGNIGFPVGEIKAVSGDEIVVLELSSYQCELASCLDPDLGIFLNFSPDHLERHGGIEGYLAAKQRMLAGSRLNSAIIGMDEAEGRMIADATVARIGREQVIGISSREVVGQGPAILCREDHLILKRSNDGEVKVDLAGCRGLRGQHNAFNAAAALAAMDALDIPIKGVADPLMSFSGLPHRSQHVGTYGGITIINDSKATNAASALQSLRAFEKIRWIAGGRAKDDGIATITDRLEEVRKAYLIGESAEEFSRQLATTPHEICQTMARAVVAAVRDASHGETILLAPAAASFDQYRDFEDRGEDFVARIRDCLKHDQGGLKNSSDDGRTGRKHQPSAPK